MWFLRATERYIGHWTAGAEIRDRQPEGPCRRRRSPDQRRRVAALFPVPALLTVAAFFLPDAVVLRVVVFSRVVVFLRPVVRVTVLPAAALDLRLVGFASGSTV